MNEKEIENRFIELETKIAYMEDFISQLQNEVVIHSKTIDLLREENKILSNRIKELSDNEEIPNRRPPHY